MNLRITTYSATLLAVAGCMAGTPEGILPAQPAKTTVRMDFFDKPLPSIPLPNDVATRYDESSATKRRVNASMVASTKLESQARELIDRLDGWGVFMPITVPFTAPLDINSILAGHRDQDYDPKNDVIYLINVDKDSQKFGQLYHLDVGNGNYPVVLEKMNYWDNDPRGWTLSLAFEEEDEDKNGNGIMDPGEDTDADGQLDKPNYLPGMNPARDDLAGRADALMYFYEVETNTLIVRPMIPLEERTTYAVVITRRLLDADGQPVGSPFPFVNDTSQTRALEPLLEVLPEGLAKEEIAFAFTFTTQTVESSFVAVREGLYGHGIQKHLGEEFPAKLAGMERVRDETMINGVKNPYVMYTENWIPRFKEMYEDIFEESTDGREYEALEQAHKYIDYHVVGSFESPQLFTRADPDGKWLPYHDQVWPEDLGSKPAGARSETVHFWLTMPRKDDPNTPTPIVILGHGYSSSRIEALPFAGHFAKHGIATIAIDCVSHGVGVSELVVEAAVNIFEDAGLKPFVQAALKDRAVDLNGDLSRDSGADFWTAYMFHTRDVVRQSALDYMQLIRILRSFDGTRRWEFDVNGDGQKELAGDFNADGIVDLGFNSTIGMTGGSLGGIMALVVGGMEPEVSVSVPIAGGGGLADIGMRSAQGGVREAVVLRTMAPVYVGTIEDTGDMKVEFIVPDLNSWASRKIDTVRNAKAGDTVVIENMTNGERGCAYISPEGRWRAGVKSDVGDLTRILFFDGIALVPGSEDCEVKDGLAPYATVDKFSREIYFQAQYTDADSPLIALAEGYGLRRGNSETRRFMGLAQLVLDPADPAVMSRHALKDRVYYPGTNQWTGAHLMVVTTVGDMNVPASSGLSIGRAAGLIDYLNVDTRFGKTQNQVLLDTFTAEAVNTYKRFTFNGDPAATGVHMDVENFSQGTDMWGTSIPRLQTGLRAGLYDNDGNPKVDALNGKSAAIFPYASPEGEHGFAFPAALRDRSVRQCKQQCTSTSGGDDPCNCDARETEFFDVGHFMFNVLGRYFVDNGERVDFDLCNSRNDCRQIRDVPPARPVESLQ